MAEACDFLRATRDSLCRQQGFAACDGVRAIAVLWVCACHALDFRSFHLVGFWKLLVPITSSIAVDLFFVLSGFLIGSALQREAQKGFGQMAWATFYLRRLFRIVPAYLSAALVTLAITRSTQDEHDGCPSLWRNVLFINNFFQLNANCLQQSWSIAVEMQLYFFTPPIFLLAEKLASCTPRLSSASWVFVLCVIAWVACCALRLQRVLAFGQEQDYGGFDADLYFFTQYKFGPYAAGVAAGVAVTMSSVSSEEGAACGAASLKTLAMIGSYAAVGLAWLNGGDFTDNVVQNPAALPWLFVLASSFLRPLLGAAVAHLLALCVTGQAPRLNGFLSARLWGPIAGLSYSMYLFQTVGTIFFYEPFLDATASAEVPNASHLVNLFRAYAAIILFILGALPLALVSYALAERPGILLGKKVISQLQHAGLPKSSRSGSTGVLLF